VTEEEVLKACERANCLDLIRSLPDGLQTIVGERGTQLSGGQRQRIAIARAFLKDAPILLLDEATSALDSVSETMIQAALEKLMKGRTVVAIAHRLSTLQNFDRIVVIQRGRLVDDGPPQELARRPGTATCCFVTSVAWRPCIDRIRASYKGQVIPDAVDRSASDGVPSGR
jgi:ATP-binding cassette subfamily B protein